MLPFILGALVVVLLMLSVYSTLQSRKRDQAMLERREQERKTRRFTTGLPEMHGFHTKNDTGFWQLVLDGQAATEPTDSQQLTEAVEALGLTAGYLLLTPPQPMQNCLNMRITPDPNGGMAVLLTLQAENSAVLTRENGGLSKPQAAKILVDFWQGQIPADVDSWQPA